MPIGGGGLCYNLPMARGKASEDTSWDGVANWYDNYLATGDTYQARVILPNLLRLIKPGKDQVILDLACGPGFFSHHLAQAGTQVIGVDLSSKLIKAAKTEAGSNEAFYRSEASHLPFIKTGSVNQALTVLALQNIRDLKPVFNEVKRVLVKGGIYHLVLNHPGFRIPGQSSWGWDSQTGKQYRRLDGYLSESERAIAMHPGKSGGEGTLSFHRPLQYYFKLLTKAGLLVSRLEEWISDKQSEPGPRAEAENQARREFPLFLYLQAYKLNYE